MLKKVIKYAIITICGMILFLVINQAANKERVVASIGGEGVFIILPLIWWVVERMFKDFIDDIKSNKTKSEEENEQLPPHKPP